MVSLDYPCLRIRNRTSDHTYPRPLAHVTNKLTTDPYNITPPPPPRGLVYFVIGGSDDDDTRLKYCPSLNQNILRYDNSNTSLYFAFILSA